MCSCDTVPTSTLSFGKSQRQAEAAWTWERLLSVVKSVKDKPADAIEEARAKKYQPNNPLLYAIKKQVLGGRRKGSPGLHPQPTPRWGARSGVHRGAGMAGGSPLGTPGGCWRAT